jgi:HlyD family secretion protein
VRPKWIALAVATGILGIVTAWALHTTTEVQVTTAEVTTGAIARRIFATGALQATRTVDVGTQVSGIVKSLDADFNSIVHANQVVAQLDPSLYDAALAQAKAARLQAEAGLNQARADLDGARTAAADVRVKYGRAAALSRENLIPQADFDAAQVALDAAVADVTSADAAVADAAALVKQAEANVTQAQVNRDHTIIRSPIDGIVLSRNVDVGQTVAAAVQAPVLFSIATDLTHLQVQVDVDQSDVGGLQIGQPITFEVESYADETFVGKVSQVRLQPIAEQSTPATTIASSTLPQTTTSVATVVSYATMIDVLNPDERLRPGMTAVVLLHGLRHDHVTRIPNNALTFRPSGSVLETLGQPDVSVSDASANTDAPTARPRSVWKFDGKRFTPIAVRVGLADDQWAELLNGDVRPGDTLVTRADLIKRSRFTTSP